jgi:hypothetical protein
MKLPMDNRHLYSIVSYELHMTSYMKKHWISQIHPNPEFGINLSVHSYGYPKSHKLPGGLLKRYPIQTLPGTGGWPASGADLCGSADQHHSTIRFRGVSSCVPEKIYVIYVLYILLI